MVRILFILAALYGIINCELHDSCSITMSFVDGHNWRRLQLANGQVPGQPAASRMTYIVWDEELATKARNWASTNQYGHNPDKSVPSGSYTVGENIYQYSTSSSNFIFDPELAMKQWWDEYADYTYDRISLEAFNGPNQIGHYTQMAWANSYKLGCGVSEYQADGWNNFFVVCNYGPAGNFIGEYPYDAGQASGQLVCGDSDCSQSYGSFC